MMKENDFAFIARCCRVDPQEDDDDEDED